MSELEMMSELEKLRKELENQKAENEYLRKQIQRNMHGRRSRCISVSDEQKIKLFGYKAVDNRLQKTTDFKYVNCNWTTFKDNLIRAILPYPRFNKNGNWIASTPISGMTDKEFEIVRELVVDIVERCIEVKDQLEEEKSNEGSITEAASDSE